MQEALNESVSCDGVLGVGHVRRVVAADDHRQVVGLQGLFALLSQRHHTPIQEAVQPLESLGVLGLVEYRHVEVVVLPEVVVVFRSRNMVYSKRSGQLRN